MQKVLLNSSRACSATFLIDYKADKVSDKSKNHKSKSRAAVVYYLTAFACRRNWITLQDDVSGRQKKNCCDVIVFSPPALFFCCPNVLRVAQIAENFLHAMQTTEKMINKSGKRRKADIKIQKFPAQNIALLIRSFCDSSRILVKVNKLEFLLLKIFQELFTLRKANNDFPAFCADTKVRTI
jgi:hypothetical protein